MVALPKLQRQQTDNSAISDATTLEKAEFSERERYEPEEDAIKEEDEDNVGHAAYLRSLTHDAIVSSVVGQ